MRWRIKWKTRNISAIKINLNLWMHINIQYRRGHIKYSIRSIVWRIRRICNSHNGWRLNRNIILIDDNSSFIIYRLITIRDKSAYPDPLSGESERYFPSFMPMDYVCNNLILLNNNEIKIYYDKINSITDSLNASH